MRKIRGVQNLVDYLESIGCSISLSTINRLMKSNEIPFTRIADRVLIFDLNEIDEWLGEGTKQS